MGNTSFTEILTALYNGNRGQARQIAETIQYKASVCRIPPTDRSKNA